MNTRVRDLIERVSPQGYAAAFWAYRFMRGSNRELRRLGTHLPHEPRIADIGAHRGLYALYFHLITRGRATIEMFEPNPYEHEHLRSLTRRYSNLHLHPVGLSSNEGGGVLHVPVFDGSLISSRATLSHMGVRGATAHQEIEVPLCSLDEVERTHAGPLDFIKCDVEGHELDVMRGAIRTLRNDRPALLVEIEHRHAGDRFAPVFELLDQLGYTGFFFQAGSPRPLHQFDRQEHQPTLEITQEFQRLPHDFVRDFLFLPREALPLNEAARWGLASSVPIGTVRAGRSSKNTRRSRQ